jgi:hypothetical protein
MRHEKGLEEMGGLEIVHVDGVIGPRRHKPGFPGEENAAILR